MAKEKTVSASRWWKAALLAMTLGLTAALAARLLLTNLWRLLAFAPDFSAIFAQLTRQTLHTPILPAVVIFPLFFLWAVRRWEQRRLSTGLIGLGLWLVTFLLNVWFIRAGGIVFGDVLCSLLPLLQAEIL